MQRTCFLEREILAPKMKKTGRWTLSALTNVAIGLKFAQFRLLRCISGRVVNIAIG